MPRLIITTLGGEVMTVEACTGGTVMEAVRDAGLTEMLALCGGCCSCATCHVHVDPEFVDRLPPVSEDESALLEGSSFHNSQSRLSCQIRMTDALDGLKVTIVPEE
jgi:2Fe-2S ferredoxin